MALTQSVSLPRKPLPPERRAVRLRDIKSIVDYVGFLYTPDKCPTCGLPLCMNVKIEAVTGLSTLTGADPNAAVIQTVGEHTFVKFDEVIFSKSAVHGGDGGDFFVPLKVRDVRDAHTFIVQLSHGLRLDELQLAKAACAPLNMHHLAAEGVIPATTVEERVVQLTTQADVDALLQGLQPEGSLCLEQDVYLPSLPESRCLRAGLTVHGRLHERGHIRRHYWKQGRARSEGWRTQRFSEVLDELPFAGRAIGEMETFARREMMKVGTWIVLRRGVSYAEVCEGDYDGNGLQVDDFISHNWSEPSRELLATLKNSKVGNCWICTFAVLQHCVVLESSSASGDDTLWYESTPFYQALLSLKKTKGRVTMCLDGEASTITRIWCIFEIWVSTDMDLSFRLCNPLGELSENQNRDLYKIEITRGEFRGKSIAERIERLSVRNADASFPQDKIKILSAIYTKQVPFDVFFWCQNGFIGNFLYKIKRGIIELFAQRWQNKQAEPEGDETRYNDEGWPVILGTKVGYESLFYCGRHDVANSADRMCGPDCGSQCPSCERFQEANIGYIVTGAEGDWAVCNGTYWLMKFRRVNGEGEFQNETTKAVIRFVPQTGDCNDSSPWIARSASDSGWRLFLPDGSPCPFVPPQGASVSPPSGEWMQNIVFNQTLACDSYDSVHEHGRNIHVIELNGNAERAVEWQVKKQCMLGPPLALARLLRNTANVFFGAVIFMIVLTSWLNIAHHNEYFGDNNPVLWLWSHSGLLLGLALVVGCGWLWIRHILYNDPWFKGLRKSLLYASGIDRIFVMLFGFEVLGLIFFGFLFPIISTKKCSGFSFCSLNEKYISKSDNIDCIAVLVMPGVREEADMPSIYPDPLFDTATVSFFIYAFAKILAWLLIMLLPPGVTVAYWRVSPCFGYIFMIVAYTIDLRCVQTGSSFLMVRFYWAGVWAWAFFRIWRNSTKWVRRYRKRSRKADGRRWGFAAILGFVIGVAVFALITWPLNRDYKQNCGLANTTLPLTFTAAPLGLVIWLVTSGFGRSTLVALLRCGREGLTITRSPLYDPNSITSALFEADRI